MDKKKLSLIIPCYNESDTLPLIVDKVLALRSLHLDIEIIIVDDASNDDSIYKIKLFNDQRLFLYTNQINEGVSKARNMGLSLATGNYILFVDSDDSLPPNAVYSMVSSMETNEVDVVFLAEFCESEV